MAGMRDRVEVVHEAALAAQQRLVLEPPQRAPDPGARFGGDAHELFLPCLERGCAATGSGDRRAGVARGGESVRDSGSARQLDEQRGRERVARAGCVDVALPATARPRGGAHQSQEAIAPSAPSVTHASRRP